VGPGAAVEVGRADHRPHVVDDHRLGVDVDRRAVLVLEVVDGHPVAAGADQVVDGPPLGGAGRPPGDPPVAVRVPWHHDDHAQPGSAAQGGREGVGDQRPPQVLVLDVDQRPGPSQGLQVRPGDAALAVGRERDPPVPGRVGAQHLHGMGAGLRGWPAAQQQLQAPGLVAGPPPYGPQRVAVVAGGVVLPALPEGVVDVQHGRAAQLQLEVVPGRPPAVAGVDPDRVGVAEMPGVITTAAGQVDAADEGDAGLGIVGAVDDQQLLVVAAEAAHPLVGHQLPSGPVDQRAQHPVGVLVEVDEGRVGAPQEPADGHPAPRQPGQQRAQLAPGTGQLAGGVDPPVGQVDPVPGRERGQQLVQAPEVGGPVDVDADPVAGHPGLPVSALEVDRRRRVAALLRGQQPGRRAVRALHQPLIARLPARWKRQLRYRRRHQTTDART
jgi:hypothetical protein